ncbi:glycosyltransferase [Acaryochloris marina]|uniref:Glycosyl transferase, family 2:TPR repeat n=1 Tax=Acaryochloris marina (strain MBIC 11017) TaxID=329726 RepID=B0C0Q9_ACAM1|nr:glycosyltransferase [Acaryochloris marina]ABW26033.1 glycosyl transferase, family 2:TPR repeat [Acaryochloris marina MBIC11017]BDM80881.1 glycosyl transferase [Acaryochloris marina MBIC10699]
MTLSLCMIVKNEAASLSRCLKSVEGWVDEMIIVDTGSTDNTPSIAQSFGAKVYNYAWNNDFAAARNFGLQYVQSDWVLVLDADEVLNPEVKPQLQGILQQENLLAVTLLRHEVGAQQSPYSLLSRLFRNHPHIRFQRPYHELIDDCVLALQKQESHWQVGHIPEVAIEHFGYQVDAIATRNKHQRACEIMAAALANNPNDAYLCSKLGALYVDMGQVEPGMHLLQQGLNLDPPEASIRYELHYHLGHTYARCQQAALALHHYQQAVQQKLPGLLKLGAYNNWANLLQDRGQYEQASQQYQQIIALQPDWAVGYYNLGLTRRAMGDLSGAIAAYRQAIQKQPDYAEAYQNLGVALFKQGQLQASQQAFSRAIALHRQHNNIAAAKQLQQGVAELGLPDFPYA